MHLQQRRVEQRLRELMSIPVFHDGIMIEIPNGLFRVAEACAGIRFLIAGGLMFAVLWLRGDPAHGRLRHPAPRHPQR